jgi:hypothetical protein
VEEDAVIRPFGLRDILAVRQLQRDGTWLDLYHVLIQQRSALTMALIAPVPWLATGLASYVWQPKSKVQGFVQMLKRPGRLEADVLYVAPGHDHEPQGKEAWERLLTFCIRNAGEHNVRRLYASLPEGSVETDLLVRLGFTIYSNEDILVLERFDSSAVAVREDRIRPRLQEDLWWLRRLTSLYTPLPVQHAEGLVDSEEPSDIPRAWWELTHEQSHVLVESGDIQGGVQLVRGRRGHWLHLHGNPADTDTMGCLVRHGLQAAAGSRKPVYCALRDYQGGLRAILGDQGFQLLSRRSRLAKQMTVPARARERSRVPSFAVEQSP